MTWKKKQANWKIESPRLSSSTKSTWRTTMRQGLGEEPVQRYFKKEFAKSLARGGCTLAMFWNRNRLSERRWRRSRGFQWPAAEKAQAWCQRCGMGRMASSSSSFRKNRWSSVSWWNSGPASHPKQWKHVPSSVSTWWLKRMPFGWTVTLVLSWEICGGMLPKKNTVWSSVGDERARSEGTSSFEDYEHNVDNLALEVVGQIGQVKWCLFSWRIGS